MRGPRAHPSGITAKGKDVETDTAKRNRLSPLEQLEAIRSFADELIENYDKLPEAYQPHSPIWDAYDSIADAIHSLSQARSGLMGDR